MNPSISAVLYVLAESTLKIDLLVKIAMNDQDSRVVLINSSRDSAPQTFPGVSMSNFNRLSKACLRTENCWKVMFQSGIKSLSVCDLILPSLNLPLMGKKIQSIQLIISEYSSALKLIFDRLNVHCFPKCIYLRCFQNSSKSDLSHVCLVFLSPG